MNELISVIIPVYNIEDYIDRCVDSVVKQTYSNLEIILVDDGSTDQSAQICDKWAKKDKRIKVIHKSNGGAADARNYGLCNVTGKYISFIDGDDYIDCRMYMTMLSYMKKYDCDISICNILKIQNGKTFVTRPYCDKKKEYVLLDNINVIKEILNDKIDVSVSNKLYKRDVIGNQKFPVGNTNEDFSFLYKVIYKSKKVIYINQSFYMYVTRSNSVTTSDFSIAQFDKYYNCKEACEFVDSNISWLKNEAKHYLWYHTFCLLKKVYLDEIESEYMTNVEELRYALKSDSMQIIKSNSLSIKEKIMYMMIAYLPNLYRMQSKKLK